MRDHSTDPSEVDENFSVWSWDFWKYYDRFLEEKPCGLLYSLLSTFIILFFIILFFTILYFAIFQQWTWLLTKNKGSSRWLFYLQNFPIPTFPLPYFHQLFLHFFDVDDGLFLHRTVWHRLDDQINGELLNPTFLVDKHWIISPYLL